MTVFGKYANFYDTLYQDKNYKKECDFLERAFKNSPTAIYKPFLTWAAGQLPTIFCWQNAVMMSRGLISLPKC
jgi:hypothetical protein